VKINRSRWMAVLLGILILAGSAGALLYRWPFWMGGPPAPLIGVVHETEIRIAPETAARFAVFKVKAGQQVRKGDVLAVLSSPELTASLEEARANATSAIANRANVEAGVRKEEVEIAAENVTIAMSNVTLAQQQHARDAALASRDFASKQQLDESTAALAVAQAKLHLVQATLAQDNAGPTKEERRIAETRVALADATIAVVESKLAKITLDSPVDGVVRLLVAEPGEAISAGQPVMTLAVGRERWFTFTIREDRLAGLAVGSRLNLMTSRGNRLDARVSELQPLGEFAVWRAARAVGDHDINSFLLRADPIGETPTLEPGMTVWIIPSR
jgi:HlyD family secretion protein